jgi:hypothetical protein
VGLNGKLSRLLALGASQRAVEHGTAQAFGAHNVVDVDGGVEGAGAVRVIEHDLRNSGHLSERTNLDRLGAVGIALAFSDLVVVVVRTGITLVGGATFVDPNGLALDVAQVTEEADISATRIHATAARNVNWVSESGAVGTGVGVDGGDWNISGKAELHRGPVHVLVWEAGVDVNLGRVGSAQAAILRVVHDGDLLGGEGHCHQQGNCRETWP